MWVPMAILAVGSVASGFLFTSGNSMVHWLAPVVNPSGAEGGAELMKPIVVSLLALGVVVIGVAYAIFKYRTVPVEAPEKVTVFTSIARRDLMQDAFNEAVLMRPGQKLTAGLVWADYSFVDGLVRAVGFTLGTTSQAVRKIQNGYARTYALVMLVGVLALVATIWMVTL
jgi:NADH-quinone oxidoreductase subunit L